MKKSCLLLLIIAFYNFAYSQSPQKISFQAVIRNSNNNLVSNSPIGLKVSLIQGSTNGNIVFSETHNTNSNSNGLVSIEIGSGTSLLNSIGSIDWAQGPYFIKTETDINGGTNYTITSTTQLLSVPYALYAENTSGSGEYAIYEEQYSSTNVPLLNTSGSAYITNIHPFNTLISQKGNSFILNSFSGTITLQPGKYKIQISTPLDQGWPQTTYLSFSGTLSNVIYSRNYPYMVSPNPLVVELDGFLNLSSPETFTLNQFLKNNNNMSSPISSAQALPNSNTVTVAKIFIQKL